MIRKQGLPQDNTPPPEKVNKGIAALEKLSLTTETAADVKQRKHKPYYSEVYAREAKIILDRLHTTGKPIRVNCTELSVVTAALQYYQGAEYLRDHDPTGKYEGLFNASKCSREFEHNYIEFKIRRKQRSILSEATIAAPWREDFLVFIENAQEGQKFSRQDVSLTDDDIAWFYNQMVTLEKLFVFRATHNEILIIRHTEV